MSSSNLRIKSVLETDEGNSRNEIGHWTNNEIRVAVQCWLWVLIEPIPWYLSRLERLNGIQWSWIQIPLDQLSIVTSNNPSVVNTMCIRSFGYTHVITSRKLRLKWAWRLAKAIAEMKSDTEQKRWNWSSCTMLALSASWTHGLISQSVRSSKQKSAVVGSNSIQANFL